MSNLTDFAVIAKRLMRVGFDYNALEIVLRNEYQHHCFEKANEAKLAQEHITKLRAVVKGDKHE